jgi:hypothetical protein
MDMRFGTWNVRSMYRAGSLRANSATSNTNLNTSVKTYIYLEL